MQAPRMLASRAGWARAGDGSSSMPRVCGTEALSPGVPPPWSIIGWVGGLCWLILTAVTLAASGASSATHVVTIQARALQHLLVFLAAALAYRIAMRLGWPAS